MMRRLLARVLLLLVLLSAGGVVVAEGHSADSPVPSQFSLVALIEAHELGGDVFLEHPPICGDCTAFATVLGLVAVLSVASPVVTAGWWPRAMPRAFPLIAFAPAAPPPR